MINKIFSFLALSLFSAVATTASAEGGNFTLKGNINGYEGKYIHILYEDNGNVKDDSVKIADGQFTFKGRINTPMAVRSLGIGNLNDYQHRKICWIYVEPTTLTVSIDKDHFAEPKVIGSMSQAQADSLRDMQRHSRDLMTGLCEEQKTLTDTSKIKEIDAQVGKLQSEMVNQLIAWVKSHPSSLIAPQQMRFLMGDMPYEDIVSTYARFTPAVKKMPECKDIEAELATLKIIRPGLPAPYFRAKSNKGEMISPADLKGKYVLLDFWATWCVPCRKSFPHVKALYEKYKDKGFDVFCVADDDNNVARWKEAIQKDGIEKFHHVLRGLKWDRSKGMAGMDKTNDISRKYAIHYLPTKYLIDPEGRIVGKFDDQELDAKLKSIFGF